MLLIYSACFNSWKQGNIDVSDFINSSQQRISKTYEECATLPFKVPEVDANGGADLLEKGSN